MRVRGQPEIGQGGRVATQHELCEVAAHAPAQARCVQTARGADAEAAEDGDVREVHHELRETVPIRVPHRRHAGEQGLGCVQGSKNGGREHSFKA